MALPSKIVPVAIVAVALAGYAGWLLVDAGREYDTMARDAYRDVDDQQVDARKQALERRRRLAAGGLVANRESRPADPLMSDADVSAPTINPHGRLTRPDAQAGFDYAMRRVEQIADRRRRLRPDEWDELYREANDAFSAYSVYVDATDVDEAAALEDAHRRLKKGLKRVRVRGKKLVR